MSYRGTTVALVAGLLAVAACGTNDPNDSGPVIAAASGLVSGSERSVGLTPEQRAAQLEAIAEWAGSNHMTGLSPMSLAPVDRAVSVDARRPRRWRLSPSSPSPRAFPACHQCHCARSATNHDDVSTPSLEGVRRARSSSTTTMKRPEAAAIPAQRHDFGTAAGLASARGSAAYAGTRWGRTTAFAISHLSVGAPTVDELGHRSELDEIDA